MQRPVRIVIAALASCLLAFLPTACGDDGGALDGDLDGSISTGDGGTSSDSDGGSNNNHNNGDADAGSNNQANPDAACASESAEAELVTLPVDIIIAIDNSCSMDAEIAATNNNINQEFAQIMGNSGLDYRVVMFSRRGTQATSSWYPVCVKAPLGDANCGTSCGPGNTTCPRFLAVDQTVNSRDALSLLSTQSQYNKFNHFLRPNSQKYFLIITDDNSDISASSFDQRLSQLTPQYNLGDYVLHAIYGYENKTECPSLAAVGSVYSTLVTNSGGTRARICDSDWKATFNQMAQAVVSGSKLACEFNVPTPPPGKTLSASSVSVLYTPGGGGTPETLTRVQDAGSCPASGTKAFYFDDNTKPTKVHICPSTCPTLQNDTAGKVQVLFKCKSSIG